MTPEEKRYFALAEPFERFEPDGNAGRVEAEAATPQETTVDSETESREDPQPEPRKAA
jgi:hypothetical protein